MAHFESDAEVYEQLGGILTNLVGNTGRLEQLRQADGVVQFAFRDPDAKVTLDVRAGKDPRVELGDSRLRPDIIFAMDADTGHALLHGELAATVALARGAVRLKGPVAKALRVVPATVGAHEVEADQPVEAVVAGAEPEAPAEAPAAEAEAPAAEAEAPAAEEAVPAGEPEAPVTPAEAPDGAAETEPAAEAEAADAAGGEEPPAAEAEQA
ncbi:MAG TPA: SCP2 sterol-binding domain-containing protein [Baekduia sp.]|nr:SCP2 sterol-binding domain-containing protein [Baekduia sp.]